MQATKQDCLCHRSAEIWNRPSALPLQCRFFDFLCTALVAEILATAFAVPVLDIALGGLCRRLCREVL